MKNTFLELTESLPVLLQNTHLNVSLKGWPAAVAVIAMSLSGVSAYAIKVMSPKPAVIISEQQHPHMSSRVVDESRMRKSS